MDFYVLILILGTLFFLTVGAYFYVTTDFVMKPEDDVELEYFMGKWYLVASSPFNKHLYCNTHTYEFAPSGVINVKFSMNVGSPEGPRKDLEGFAYTPVRDEPTKYYVTLYGY